MNFLNDDRFIVLLGLSAMIRGMPERVATVVDYHSEEQLKEIFTNFLLAYKSE